MRDESRAPHTQRDWICLNTTVFIHTCNYHPTQIVELLGASRVESEWNLDGGIFVTCAVKSHVVCAMGRVGRISFPPRDLPSRGRDCWMTHSLQTPSVSGIVDAKKSDATTFHASSHPLAGPIVVFYVRSCSLSFPPFRDESSQIGTIRPMQPSVPCAQLIAI